MTMSKRIDIASLVKEAERSEQREAYIVVEKTRKYRIGEGVRLSATTPSFFLEVIIHHRSKNRQSSDFATQILILSALQERGYSVSCQEETCTVLELMLSSDSVVSEVAYLKTMLKNIFQD
jgi:hypothetical protein